jgi:hypothetical protein
MPNDVTGMHGNKWSWSPVSPLMVPYRVAMTCKSSPAPQWWYNPSRSNSNLHGLIETTHSIWLHSTSGRWSINATLECMLLLKFTYQCLPTPSNRAICDVFHPKVKQNVIYGSRTINQVWTKNDPWMNSLGVCFVWFSDVIIQHNYSLLL